MKRLLGVAMFVVVAFGPMLAQQTTVSDEPATKEDIQKLFVTMHIREQMRNIMELASKQSKQTGHNALKKKLPGISQKDLDRMDAMSDQIIKSFDIDGMIDDMIPVYQRHLTKVDVAAMAAFYETPTGQKMLREQPQMTAEAMKALQPRMEKMMASILDEADQMAKEAATESKPASDKN